jgi:hypothetical protein
MALNLSPGERIIFQGHPSWRAILGFYLKGILVAALAGVVFKLFGASSGTVFLVVLVIVGVTVLLRAWAPRPAAVSASRRKTGIGASRATSRASICSVPAPARESVVESQLPQLRGSGSACAQWWQTSRSPSRWTISETSQLGQLQ